MKKPESLSIFGASARGACWSAVRCGLKPRAYDRFRDLDFPANCPVELISDPLNLKQATNLSRYCLPVGGWEIEPELMDQLEANFEMLNTSTKMTKRARDPFLLQQILRKRQLPHLSVTQNHKDLATGQWIRKPISGTGGIGCQRVNSSSPPCPDTEYDQQYKQGDCCSAILFALQSGEILLLGMTKQLIGSPQVPQRPFAYAGSCGPIFSGQSQHEIKLRTTLLAMANAISQTITFYGLFCLDFILCESVPFLTEINPRYSASVEILELAHQKSYLKLFFDEQSEMTPVHSESRPESELIAKAFLYAPQNFQIPQNWNWNIFAQCCATKQSKQPAATSCKINGWAYNAWQVPIISDLPQPGEFFEQADPVCTLWATGKNMNECQQQLEMKKQQLMQAMEIS